MSATLNTKSNVNNFVDDSSEEEEDVEICLPDGPLDGSDLHDPFVSRIGGLPTWLNDDDDVTKNPSCGSCGSKMFLLLQVDAPIPERPQIDRIIYVFACNTRICTEGFLKDAENGAFSVIIQIRQSQEDIKTSFADRVVEKKSFFDDLMDDTPDETKVLGPIKPNDDNIRSVSNVFKTIGIHDEQPFFPPIRLRIVEELIASSSRIGTKPSKNGDFSATNYKIEDANPEEVYEQMEVSGYDKFFKAFHTRVSHYPRQCVRYAPDSKPLIFSETSHLENPNAANLTCSCTGPSKPMSFDLQLMPAILSILPTNTEQNLRHIPKEKRATHQLFGDGMEWGTVLVYTCHICCAKGRVRVHTEQ